MKPKHRRRMMGVLKGFDFDKVHRMMLAEDWFWAMKDAWRTPTIEELKDSAKYLLNKAYPGQRVATGGFTAEWRKGHCFLAFYIDDVDSV